MLLLFLVCSSSSSCAPPLSCVLFLFLMCWSSSSCVAPLSHVLILFFMCCFSSSCVVSLFPPFLSTKRDGIPDIRNIVCIRTEGGLAAGESDRNLECWATGMNTVASRNTLAKLECRESLARTLCLLLKEMSCLSALQYTKKRRKQRSIQFVLAIP